MKYSRFARMWNEINLLMPVSLSHCIAIFHIRRIFHKSRKGFISLKKRQISYRNLSLFHGASDDLPDATRRHARGLGNRSPKGCRFASKTALFKSRHNLLQKIKKAPFWVPFLFWCEWRDLNSYVMDTRPSNVPVCLFQHTREFSALDYYII